MPHVGASFALHAALLVAAALATPSLGETPQPAWDAQDHVTHAVLIAVTDAAAEVEEERRAPEPAEHDPDEQERGQSRCDDRNGGSMGVHAEDERDHRYGVQGPSDNPDPHLARDARPRDSTPWLSMIGPLDGHLGGDPNAPTIVWGRDDSLGNDPSSARGHMWGVMFGRASGSAGVGLGLRKLCETCGHHGRGAGERARTALAAATDTESTCPDAG